MAQGAFTKDPPGNRTGRVQIQRQAGRKGALSQNPSGKRAEWQAPIELSAIDQQIAQVQKEIARRGGPGNAANFEQRLQALQSARNNANTVGVNPIEEGPAQGMPNFVDVTGQSNQALSGVFNQMQQQGAFNPGDFTSQMEKARGSVMEQFNRRMEPQFQQQDVQFRQQMAEQGVPEGSELYNRQYQQMQQAQNDARLSAANSAESQAQQVQAQGWNQGFQGYQLPMAQLNALSPYYGTQGQMTLQQGQQQWQGAQNEAERSFQKELEGLRNKYALQQIRSTPRGGGGGGGGLTYEQQLALQRERSNSELDNAILLGSMQGGGGGRGISAGNAAASGLASGVGAALGSALR